MPYYSSTTMIYSISELIKDVCNEFMQSGSVICQFDNGYPILQYCSISYCHRFNFFALMQASYYCNLIISSHVPVTESM
jgi:hypothetical protein